MTKVIRSSLSRTKIILFLILLLAFFFRFYKLIDWFPFGMDQEYEAFLVKNIVEGVHIPLIGVNASDTGIYLGPFFIYLAVLPYSIFGGNPLGFAFFASMLGVFTTFMIYYLVKKMFSVSAGLLSAFFYAVSFLASYYDRNFWNPTLVPLLSLLIGYFIYEINNKRYKFLIYLSLVFGLSLHTHLSLLIFSPLIIWIVIKNFKHIRKKVLIWSIVLFLGVQIPQIIFELRHNFTNTKAVVNLISGLIRSDQIGPSIFDRTKIFINFMGRFLWVAPGADLFVEKDLCRDLSGLQKNAYPEIVGIIFLVLCYFFYCHIRFHLNKDQASVYKIIISVLLLSILAVFLYNRDFSEYYFLFLMPYLAIILGISLSYLLQKKQGYQTVLFFMVLFFGLNLATLMTAGNSYSYNSKLAIIDFSKKYVGSDNYSLEALGDCPRFEGWRYLFEYHMGKPVHSYMDSYYDWLYYSKGVSEEPEKIILLSMIDPRSGQEKIAKWEEEKINFLSKYNVITQKLIDNIHVFILTPKK